MFNSFSPSIRNYRSVVTTSLLLSLLLGSTYFSPLRANAYTVGPLLTIIDVKSSQARATIDINNSGQEPIRIRIYVEDFTYDRDQGFRVTNSHPYSAVQHLQFSPRELTVPPQTTRNVRVNILIPPTAPNGEYRAVVFAEELKDEPKAPEGGAAAINTKTRIGSIFFVNKGGSSADIAVNNMVWNSVKKQPQIILENKGSTTSNPSLQWKIERDGQEIDSGLTPNLIVQNHSERVVDLSTKKASKLIAGEYTVTGKIRLKDGILKPFLFKLKIP
jgi:P pilus assembly chaperone PapD